jgi:hypothetical protein
MAVPGERTETLDMREEPEWREEGGGGAMPRTDKASTTDFSYFFVVVDDRRRDVLKCSGGFSWSYSPS